MSTDDFQSKYASVMESMLKSAIAETTKLFETMVDELKAEISRIKKENKDLRARCSQFEEKQSTVYSRGHQAPSHPCSEKRDTAVQCDLVPLRTMLVEQCQSLEYSSLQIEQQQCCQWEMENRLQDHNYGNGNSQMTLMLVKEEESYDDSSLLPVIKQEDVEPNVFCGKVTNAGSARGTTCGNENEGSLIDHMCSTGEMFENDEETRVPLELRCHGMDNDLERAQNQPSEPEHPLVITIKCDMGDQTEGLLVTSEEQTFVTAQQQSMVELQKEQLSVVPQQCHREGEMSISEQTDATVQQYANVQCTEEHLPEPTTQNIEIACKEQKNGMAESDASTQPVRRRRGRPPKKVKQLQQPVKETDVTTEQDVVNSPLVRVEEVEVSSAIDKVDTTESAAPLSKEKNNNQDMYDSEYVPPPTPPKVSAPVLDISTEAISKPSAVEPISNLEKEIFSNAMQGCARSNDAAIAEKGSANLIQLTSIPSKDRSDPHLQMSKTQFLAQLAVSPVVQAPKKPLSVIGGRLLKNQCGECGRILSSSAALESHVSLHRGRRPFSCTLCGKSFPDSKGLKRHGRVHRNGRIHICQECGKGFVYRFGLTKHLQMLTMVISQF
ncbi:zinc finger protein 1-like [Hippoglossus hippoglossus]|uniref:zinc finger protein 1-like n=1 Tax=Hippoglossus hippoglossus TaxID=8267 RepID=UPI00148C385E|nr:zinc finger protein 1-like [Hippoglossus hippoglossus]